MIYVARERLALWLWVLFAIFCFRVLAQLLQWQFSLSFLPSFDSWHSDSLPYGVLLMFQVFVIIVMVSVCSRFSRRKVVAHRLVGISLLIAGSIYLLIMFGRLLIGLFLLPEDSWFGQYLPAMFHLVLALFILLVGGFHFSNCSSV